MFGKKSSQAIHWITAISMVGIAVGSAALILVLSVFNGFETLLSSMFSKHNPDVKIIAKIGKTFDPDSHKIAQLNAWPEIEAVSYCLQEVVMFEYSHSQEFGQLLGVSANYKTVSKIDEAIVEGRFALYSQTSALANIGIGLRNKLGISLNDYLYDLKVFAPEGEHSSSGGLYTTHTLIPQSVFRFNNETDYNTVIAPLEIVQRFLKMNNKVSSIELKLNPKFPTNEAIRKLENLFGNEFLVKDRFKQDEAFIKIMNLEKWLFFALFSLTMILVSFTVVGALYMIVLDKRQDIAILKSMGMSDHHIKALFTILGFFICTIGLLVGFTLSISFFLIQKKYGIIRVPDEFIIDTYPIQLQAGDFLIVGITVMLIGWLATILPSKKVGELKPIFREE